MAQSRLINKKITLSERVADLHPTAQLLYTWSILHADDAGLLQGSARTIKAQVIPMLDVTTKEVSDWISKMLSLNLWAEVTYKDRHYYQITKFADNQRYRKDIMPYTILPLEPSKNYLEAWKIFDKAVSELQDVKKNS